MLEKYEGTLVFSGEDRYGVVEIVDKETLRYLHLGTQIRQSSMFLNDPYALAVEYTQQMTVSLLFQPQPHRVLFLGLGGGSLPKFFWSHLPNCRVDAVEISPLVIETSMNFFNVPREDSRMHLINEDANYFLKRAQNRLYDLIFVDLYSSEGISSAVSRSDFFDQCFRLLKKTGILVWNMWRIGDPTTIQKTLKNMARVFGRNLLALPATHDSIFILFMFKDSPTHYSMEKISENARTFHAKTHIDFETFLSKLDWSAVCSV